MPSGMRAQARDSRAETPWWLVEAVDKKKARLNCIRHLLTQTPSARCRGRRSFFPQARHHPDYRRRPIPKDRYVADAD
jgi:hypothetical protein